MHRAIVGFLVCLLAGCSATYIPPGPRADLQLFAPAGAPDSPSKIRDGFALKPVAPFPATVAAVRVQAPSYTNFTLRKQGNGVFGTGRYSVVTVRDVEDDAQYDRIAHLPQLAGLASINRMLLPAQLESDQELREAAARLQADMVLIYTFDTSFFDTDLSRPITLLTLGLAPTRRAYVSTTASALLLDTRTGYLYAALEETSKSEVLSTSWGSVDSMDEARRKNEHDSFDKLVNDFTAAWPRIVAQNSKHG